MDGSGADELLDVRAEITADDADLSFNTDLLRGTFHEGVSTGIRVMDWSDKLYITAGVDHEDKRATIGQELSPENARELADALNSAADAVEADDTNISEAPSSSSIVERLIGWGTNKEADSEGKSDL